MPEYLVRYNGEKAALGCEDDDGILHVLVEDVSSLPPKDLNKIITELNLLLSMTGF